MASLAAVPKRLAGNPAGAAGAGPADDVLSQVLRTIRLSGSLQFCFMPSGAWQTDTAPAMGALAPNASSAIPFHIVVEGGCWLKMDGIDMALAAGDVVAFPFGTGHQLGAGSGGITVTPTRDLPPRPWRDIPVMRYGEGPAGARLLCGFLQCDALSFAPLRNALPALMHARADGDEGSWLRATIAQMTGEVDRPRSGGVSVLERLTELVFIELLRQEILRLRPDSVGWLAALADPGLGRCLSLMHADPGRDWSVAALATASGLSRSTLMERFEAIMRTSPVRYLRAWRLCLASVALASSDRPIADIAYEAGYGSEAAFSRAFARAHGAPPAAWRSGARNGESGRAG